MLTLGIREGIILAAVAAAALQTYRLEVESSAHDLLKASVEAAKREAAQEAFRNARNKERTDEEYTAGRQRAASVVVQVKPSRGISSKTGDTGGVEGDIACFDRRALNEGIGRIFGEAAGRLTTIARDYESLASAYRACRSWAKDVGK